MSTRAQMIGKAGEEIAAQFLRMRGCAVLARNAYGDGGEIDLIVDDDGSVAAVEVKASTRRDAIERVDGRKWDLVHRTGASSGYVITRFDIITVWLCPLGADVRWMRAVD